MTEVTEKQLKKLQEKFKSGYKGYYIPDLVTAMNARKEELRPDENANDFIERDIYLIFAGKVKNQFVRAALIEEGNKLLIVYKERINGVKDNVQ